MNNLIISLRSMALAAASAMALVAHGASEEHFLEDAKPKEKQPSAELIDQREHAVALAKAGKLLEAEARALVKKVFDGAKKTFDAEHPKTQKYKDFWQGLQGVAENKC